MKGFHFFGRAKQSVVHNPVLARHGIKVEHYVVSTGLREMILGSQIGPLMDDIWACEFVEVVAQPGYLKKDQPSLFDGTNKPTRVDIGYVIDNTSKTATIRRSLAVPAPSMPADEKETF